MEPQMFDFVKFEKEKAVARFNSLRRTVKLRQVFEVLVVFGMISWSSARVPAAVKAAAICVVEFSTYLFNHHVVFLIGNVIIVALVVLCRRSGGVSLSDGGDFYDDYVKHSEAAAAAAVHQSPPPTDVSDRVPPPEDEIGDEEKQIVVCFEETTKVPQCDDVSAAIEKATKQIRRFQRTQSEKLKREISVRPQAELRRSETDNHRKSVTSGEELHASEIETLSNEDFRRTVDAFIDKHWSNKKSKSKSKQNQFEEFEKKYQFVNENVKSVRLQA